MERMDDMEEKEEGEEEEEERSSNIYSALDLSLQTMASPKTICIKLGKEEDFVYPTILAVTRTSSDIIENLKNFSTKSQELMPKLFKDCLNNIYENTDGSLPILADLIRDSSPIQLCKFTLFYNSIGESEKKEGKYSFENLKLIPTFYNIDSTGLVVLNPTVLHNNEVRREVYKLIYFSIINALTEIFTKIVPSDLEKKEASKSISFSFDYYPNRKIYSQIGKRDANTLGFHKDMAGYVFSRDPPGSVKYPPYISLLFLNTSDHGIDIPIRGTSVLCSTSIADASCDETYIFTPEIRSGYSITFNDEIITHSTPSAKIISTDWDRTMRTGKSRQWDSTGKPKLMKEVRSSHVHMLSELSHRIKFPVDEIQAIIEDPKKKRTFIRTHYIYKDYNIDDFNTLINSNPIGVQELGGIERVRLRPLPTIEDILRLFSPNRTQLSEDKKNLINAYKKYYEDYSMNSLPKVDVPVLIDDVSELNNLLKGLQGEFGFGKSKSKNKKNKTKSKYKRNRKNKTKKRNKK